MKLFWCEEMLNVTTKLLHCYTALLNFTFVFYKHHSLTVHKIKKQGNHLVFRLVKEKVHVRDFCAMHAVACQGQGRGNGRFL